MIQVAIIADTPSRARTVRRLLEEEESLEVVDGGGEVLVVAGLPIDRLTASSTPVVVLSNDRADEVPIGGVIRAWLPLETAGAELTAAIVAARNDLVVLTGRQAEEWLGAKRELESAVESLVEKLTPRELQVLRMVADGLGNKEIAGQLGISDHTAKFHVAQILGKLGAASRTEAVAIGIRSGLVPV